MKRVGSLILSAVVAAALLLVPTPANATFTCPTPQGVQPNKNVAVLVHGWLGAEMVAEQPLLQEVLGPNWSVVTFDYGDLNTMWPSSSGVYRCLNDFGKAAQQATGLTAPSVYVVGHSMGGLMARFAFDSRYPGGSEFAAGVVTIDTPHTGSPWGMTRAANLAEAGANFLTQRKGDAKNCLASHHPGSLPSSCGYPPPLASDVPIAQVAGDITITRTYFNFGRQRADIFSDGIVWLDSQVGYKKSLDNKFTNQVESSYTVYCDLAWGDTVTFANQLTFGAFSPTTLRWMTGETLDLMQNGTAAVANDINALVVLNAASHVASCGHNAIPHNNEALTAAADYLRAWAEASARANRWVITSEGVGPVKFGSTLEQLREHLTIDYRSDFCSWVQEGIPTSHPDAEWRVYSWHQENEDKYDMFIVTGTAVGVDVPDYGGSAPALSNGISLGSTSDDLLAAGLTSEPGNNLSGDSSRYWRYTDEGVPGIIETYNDRVSLIMIGSDYLSPEWCA